MRPGPGLEKNPKVGSNLQVDIRLLEYVDDVDLNLMCPICHCPFIEPLRLRCDHTFCRHCLRRALETQNQDSKTCPSCRSPTSNTDALPVPRFFLHLIDDLQVRCPKQSSGCEAQVRRSDVQNHVDHYCDYTDVACSFEECKLLVARKDRAQDCQHQDTMCESCEMQVMKGQLQDHVQNRCTKRASQCPDCFHNIAQHEFSKHRNECPQAEVKCLASGLGCGVICFRASMPEHETGCTLTALLPTIQAMQHCIENQGAALKVLQHKNDDLEASFAAIKAILGEDTLSMDARPAPLTETAQPITPSSAAPEYPPFDSATHHLLSLHESLREEVDRVTSAVSTLDARTSMMIMNESLRVKEDMAHTNAAIGAMRMQLQWLTSARLQAQRSPVAATNVSAQNGGQAQASGPPGPVRRLSDLNKQELKL